MSEQYHTPLEPPVPRGTGERQDWSRLHGNGPSLALANAARRHGGPLVVLAPDTPGAQRLEENLQFFMEADAPLLNFPDWETLSYDLFSPHQDIISARLATLYHLPDLRRGILVLPITTLMQRLPPPDYVQANTLLLQKGERLDREKMRTRLEFSGYRAVAQVMEHGEFAVRGSLLDLFPMGASQPFRIDLFDEEIDSIRYFDPDTQRTRGQVEEIRLLPAREFPMTEEAIGLFRQQWREAFGGDPMRAPIYREVSAGHAPAGLEYYLPLFFQETRALFDYLPESSLLAMLPGTLEAAEQFWRETGERYEQLRHDIERPILPPTRLFLQAGEVFQQVKAYPRINLLPPDEEPAVDKAGVIRFASQSPPALPVDSRGGAPLAKLQAFLDEFQGRVLFVAETGGRRESLQELLEKHQIRPTREDNWREFLDSPDSPCLAIAPLDQGLLLEQPPLAVITEAQLFGERVAQRRLRKTSARDSDAVVRDLTELNLGSPVVHEEHGVGRYQGLISLDVGGFPAEFLQLEYAGGDKLYVPVASLHLISRFTGMDAEHAPLHKLGGAQWEKARRKAQEKVRDVAAELLELHARRAAREGHVFRHDPDAYRAFVQGFAFEETPDQQAAINAVMADLSAPRPMDRLICGDVGFGKTEVAMRAAFVATQDGRQVAVLVPTTLLAQQHFQNFSDRFADWPIRVEQLSRFRAGKEQTRILAGLADGTVDIVIGTHKLLQDNIKFKRLGLLIIDEEHRFGVRQKERFKQLRAEVDILTLTATPIPRSLNLALSELRALSIIATPPSKRLAIKTFVQEWRPGVLSEAIMRELRRGGQVYFLHNEVASIEKMAEKVRELVPEANPRVAHGQMPERELERVMRDFYHRRFNVLVCTTIIETGIDVPTANTMIINRADRFGLAQLYQLRGRVGRSHHQAYAYLITPPRKSMTVDAVKRLEALGSLEELGVGFTLATHDLEIRGAGEILGEEQSGHIQEIGYSLYSRLLERAVEALRQGKQPELDRPLDQGSEINLQVPALLPEEYLPDIHTRLMLYKRIASAPDPETLDDIQVEMVDRFGLLPPAAKNLFRLTELKLKAAPLGIRKIEFGEQGGRIQFIPEPPVDVGKIIRMIQGDPHNLRLDAASNTLKIARRIPEFEQRIAFLDEMVTGLLN